MIERRNLSDQFSRYNIKTYEKIRNIPTDPGDDFTAGCLLDYPYSKENYEWIAIF